MKRAQVLKTLLKVLVSVGILAFLISNLQNDNLLKAFKLIAPWQFALAVLFYLFCQLISTFRWLQLARSMRISGQMRQYYGYYLKGMFLNLFLPTAVGGDFGRALLQSKAQSSTWMHAFLSILAERFCGLSGLMLFIVAGYVATQTGQWSILTLISLLLLTFAVITFTLGFRWLEHHPWSHWFIRMFVLKQGDENQDPGEIWPHRKALLTGLLISLVFHALCTALKVVILGLLGADVSYLTVAAIYGLSGLASMIPVSLSGIGLREGSTTLLLMYWAHLPQDVATAYSLIWLSILLMATLPGGVLLLQQTFMQKKSSAPSLASKTNS